MLPALTIPIKEFLMKTSFLEIVKTELGLSISNEQTACLLKNLWLRPANNSSRRHANSLVFNFTLETQCLQTSANSKLWSISTSDQYWKCDRNQCELYNFRNRLCPDLKCLLILYNGILCPLIMSQYAILQCYLLKPAFSYLFSLIVCSSL